MSMPKLDITPPSPLAPPAQPSPPSSLWPSLPSSSFASSPAICFVFPGDLVWAFSKAHVRSIPGPSGFVLALSGSTTHRMLNSSTRRLDGILRRLHPVHCVQPPRHSKGDPQQFGLR
ncbi:hypothetical protein Cni_G17561 [Canna indica]|uniref:Uncharacterized protein n=1 Tax=Canna indica TaxID=4628 RepID=A0AAQ3KHC5_9LILI|nr:hypothetical protein Cni_G17561 [Canna indica]